MSYFPFSLNWYAFYDDIETTIKYEKKKKNSRGVTRKISV